MTDENRAADAETETPAEPPPPRDWVQLLTRIALVLALGALTVSLIAAIGSGQGLWHFRAGFTVLRYAFFVAAAGAVVALVGLVLARRAHRVGMMLPNLIALVVALGFVLYLGSWYAQARSVPAIHDVSTNLDDLPQFSRLQVREDNLDSVPDMNNPELAALPPEERWKAVHREHYDDLQTLTLPMPPADVIRKAERLARDRGWKIARVDTAAGILEATETSAFFRFSDDIVVRARPAPDGAGSLVDMRSISRVGASDVGMNAERVRDFLEDLRGQG